MSKIPRVVDAFARRLQVQEHSISLLPENKKYGSIQVAQLSDYSTWGIVTFVIHAL